MPEQRNTRGRKKDVLNLDTLGLEMGTKPPQALDVEEAVLGAMLIEPSVVDDTVEDLTPSCFYDERHRMIFEAILKLANEHAPVDILTVAQKLRQLGNLEAAGGPVALAELSRKIGAAAHVEFHVKVLKQKHIQRELITASYDILKSSYDDSVNVEDLIDTAQAKVFAAIQDNVKKDVEEIGSVITKAMSDIERLQGQKGYTGVPSGLTTLDRITLGWQPSDLIILAARPSVGKTAFVLNIARNAAVDYNFPVAIFSLEMPSIQLVKRMMVTETGMPADKIKGGVRLESYEWKELETRLAHLAKAPLYIDDTAQLPVMEFRSKVKRLVKQKGVRLVIVDYLQLMQGPAELRSMREQEVAAISRTLKATAKELNVPIIALSQLSRQAVQRGTTSNGRPQLNDLRESGSIEQDADMVLFIHRADYQGLSENPEDKGKTTLIIAKHRNGEIGDVDLYFRAERVRFEDPSEAASEFQGGIVESAMNGMDMISSDDFGSNNDF
ncbi:MAG: replicative DNA helicase [Bacteroidales bacterium]|nr:replicative DNA helicase [Bacteroidales bacterium]